MNAPVVALEEVRKVFRDGRSEIVALRDVTLELAHGEMAAVVGRSGSGKTTLLNVLAGWESVDSGRVLWEGHQTDPSLVEWARLGIVPQTLGLIEEFTLRENVRYPHRLARRTDVGEADALLGALGIEDVADRYPNQTSLGEQQRAAIARALALWPDVVLLDEPTAHLDTERARDVFALLADAARRGTTCLVATHATEFVETAARVLRMKDGALMQVAAGHAT